MLQLNEFLQHMNYITYRVANCVYTLLPWFLWKSCRFLILNTADQSTVSPRINVHAFIFEDALSFRIQVHALTFEHKKYFK